MKLKNCIIATVLLGVTHSYGALYTLNNGAGATASGIRTTSGTTFRNSTIAGASLGGTNGGTSAGPGVVAFGVFSTDALSSLSSSELISSFTMFGSSTFTYAAAGGSGSRSVFSAAATSTITGSAFAGKAIYLFTGNGTTFGNSTEFLVAKSNSLTFAAGDDTANAISPKVMTIRPGDSTVLFGSTNANVFTTNTDSSQTAGWTMASPIPEPSAALLGAIGVLGLLRRRRN
jgi:MYXO-CTERM domain-containing protein